MSTLDTLAQKYRALRCNHIPNHLPEVLAEAEANERSYLDLADRLIDLEIEGRAKNSVAMHLNQRLHRGQAPGGIRLPPSNHHHQAPGPRPAGPPLHR